MDPRSKERRTHAWRIHAHAGCKRGWGPRARRFRHVPVGAAFPPLAPGPRRAFPWKRCAAPQRRRPSARAPRPCRARRPPHNQPGAAARAALPPRAAPGVRAARRPLAAPLRRRRPPASPHASSLGAAPAATRRALHYPALWLRALWEASPNSCRPAPRRRLAACMRLPVDPVRASARKQRACMFPHDMAPTPRPAPRAPRRSSNQSIRSPRPAAGPATPRARRPRPWGGGAWQVATAGLTPGPRPRSHACPIRVSSCVRLAAFDLLP